MKHSRQKKQEMIKSSPSAEKNSQISEEETQELSKEDETEKDQSLTEEISEMKRIESRESAKLVSDQGMVTVGGKTNCITCCFPP